MIRRLSLQWPSSAGRTVRLLAVSDEAEPALDFDSNRAALGQIDGVLGCGDLEPAYLAFLADAFHAPLLYVRGNHDRGANWTGLESVLPRPLNGRLDHVAGIMVAGLSWPGEGRGQAVRDEGAAWRQALGLAWRARGQRTHIVVSHVPPRGLGDTPEDHYHRGFAAYHWLCRRLDPIIWLHGHTSLAATDEWRTDWGSTTLVNATGAVLLELTAAIRAGATIGPATTSEGALEVRS